MFCLKVGDRRIILDLLLLNSNKLVCLWYPTEPAKLSTCSQPQTLQRLLPRPCCAQGMLGRLRQAVALATVAVHSFAKTPLAAGYSRGS